LQFCSGYPNDAFFYIITNIKALENALPLSAVHFQAVSFIFRPPAYFLINLYARIPLSIFLSNFKEFCLRERQSANKTFSLTNITPSLY